MMAKGGEGDVEVIRNVLSVQHVPVVGTLAWDKLQFLLHSLCDQISSQAARLEKAEEQGKSLASFKDELNLLCQNALTAANADKEAEAKKQAEYWASMEARLKALETMVAYEEQVIAQLAPLPNTVSLVEEQVHNLDSQVHKLDNDLQKFDPETSTKAAAQNSGKSPPDLEKTSTPADLRERIEQLEAQIEEFKELMQHVTKAHTADLEAIQNSQRSLRAHLEAKPMPLTAGGGGKTNLAELQKRLEQKVDVEAVDQSFCASTNTKEELETLPKAIEELKKDFENQDHQQHWMDNNNRLAPTEVEDYGPRFKKIEDNLAELIDILSTKADQTTIDDMQYKFASNGGGGGGDTCGGENSLKCTDALKQLHEKLNLLNNSVVALAERSDLGVLLAKRAEQISHPAALIQGTSGHTDDEEIQFVVNEHANRIMVYADMLLQMQVVLATKVDNIAFLALKEIVEKLQKDGGTNQIQSEAQIRTQQTLIDAQQNMAEVQQKMTDSIKSHEKMLMKLLEDVGVLGKGVLIMSGHDDEFQPALIPPSATLSPPDSQGGDVLSPNSLQSEIATEGPDVSKPTAPPSTDVPTQKPTSPQPSPPVVVPPESVPESASAPAPTPTSAPESTSTFSTDIASASPTIVSGSAPPTVRDTNVTSSSSRQGTPTQQGFSTPRKASQFTSPSHTQRGSALHITNIQEASQVLAQSKYHDALGVLEEALNTKKIEPKENVTVLKQLVLEVEKMSIELESNLILIDNLEQNKVDKIDFQALAKLIRELKVMENAMLSGKPLLGFKCMSCSHDLERLSPTRGPHIPTGAMPRSFLSMLSAERIFCLDKRDISPLGTPPRTPPNNCTSDYMKPLKKTVNNIMQIKRGHEWCL